MDVRPQKQNASFAYVDEATLGPSYCCVRVIQADTDPLGSHSHAWCSAIWARPRD